MKSIYIILFSIILSNCSSKTINEISAIGNDRDLNGCIGSAGYIWSYAKKRCIRLWEEGTKFEIYNSDNALVKENIKTIFVILSDDKSTAEIIFDDNETPILLKRKEHSERDIDPIVFENDNFNIEIQFSRDTYWVVVDNAVEYFNNDLTVNGFGKKMQ